MNVCSECKLDKSKIVLIIIAIVFINKISFILDINEVRTNDDIKVKRHGSPESSTPDEVTLVTKKTRITEPEMEAASSTTSTEGPPRLPVDPAEWTVEDVIQHISCVDIQLNTFADLFRKHVSFQI